MNINLNHKKIHLQGMLKISVRRSETEIIENIQPLLVDNLETFVNSLAERKSQDVIENPAKKGTLFSKIATFSSTAKDSSELPKNEPELCSLVASSTPKLVPNNPQVFPSTPNCEILRIDTLLPNHMWEQLKKLPEQQGKII